VRQPLLTSKRPRRLLERPMLIRELEIHVRNMAAARLPTTALRRGPAPWALDAWPSVLLRGTRAAGGDISARLDWDALDEAVSIAALPAGYGDRTRRVGIWPSDRKACPVDADQSDEFLTPPALQ
jgi:hypothetical protein